MEAGFKRLYRYPKRTLRGATLESLTPRGKYIANASMQRYLRRADAYDYSNFTMPGELGCVESFRFIFSEQLP